MIYLITYRSSPILITKLWHIEEKRKFPLVQSTISIWKNSTKSFQTQIGIYLSNSNWSLLIMSSLHALCCFPSVKKQIHFIFSISLHSMHNKTIIRFDFCDFQKVSVGVISRSRWPWLIWISQKTSSNIFLLFPKYSKKLCYNTM